MSISPCSFGGHGTDTWWGSVRLLSSPGGYFSSVVPRRCRETARSQSHGGERDTWRILKRIFGSFNSLCLCGLELRWHNMLRLYLRAIFFFFFFFFLFVFYVFIFYPKKNRLFISFGLCIFFFFYFFSIISDHPKFS